MMVNNDLEKSFSSGDCLKNSSVIDEKAKAISSVNIMSTNIMSSKKQKTKNVKFREQSRLQSETLSS